MKKKIYPFDYHGFSFSRSVCYLCKDLEEKSREVNPDGPEFLDVRNFYFPEFWGIGKRYEKHIKSLNSDHIIHLAKEISSRQRKDSQTELERILSADFSFPILTLKVNSKHIILDGIHRLLNSIVNGHSEIKGYTVSPVDMSHLPMYTTEEISAKRKQHDQKEFDLEKYFGVDE
tara:strand:- start:827 stop:1348 length:522 start_codon:yes stop_codon:yes gene_type:complete